MSEAIDKSSSQDSSRSFAREAFTNLDTSARASVVNRTHRVVRERAKTIAARRSRIRSLWIPVGVCSSLLVILCTAVWSALDAYDVTPTGVPDASNQFLVLCLWFFPVSMALLAVVLFRRGRKREVV
ncbi:hypothetical protein [Tunturiibacter lichenicola]|uniref:hypothetical protein n=1 Tax=Tunturiibacter lichenicola TaxID=2051959 RepID=UPI003D9B9C72